MAQVIRRAVTAANKRIGVVSFDTDAAEVGNALANAGETLRQTAYRIDAQDAEEAGAKAAAAIEESKFRSFDENGKPIALKVPDGYGRIARQKFQEVAERRFIETMDNDIRLEAKRLGVKHDRNPLGFQNEMDAYLQGLSKLSDGRFRQYINSVGNAVKEGTYIGLIEKERNRSRQDNAEFINLQNEESKSNISHLASQDDKGLSSSLSYAYERATATKDAEDADLFKIGASQSYFNEAKGIAASSNIISEVSKQNFTALERALLEQSIATFGQDSGNAKVNALYNKTIQFKAGDKTKTILLRDLIDGSNQVDVQRRLASAFQDINSVETIIRLNQEDAKRKQEQDFVVRENKFNTEVSSLIDDYTRNAFKNARSAFTEGSSIESGVFSAFKDYQSFANKIDTEVQQNPQFTASEGQVAKNRAMYQIALPYVKRAAATGKPENFMAALSTLSTNSDAFKAATPEQQEVIIALNKHNLINENLAGEFSAAINQSSSALVEQQKQEETTIDLIDQFDDLMVDYRNKQASEKDIQKFFSTFDKQTKGFIGIGETKLKLQGFVEKEDARTKLLSFIHSSPLNDSTFIKNVQYYMLTGDDSFLKVDDKRNIDSIIKDLPLSTQKELTSLVEKIAVDRSQIEQKASKKIELNNNIKKFESMALPKNQGSEISQLLLDQKGFNIADQKTWTEENMRIAAKYMPQDIGNQLKNFARTGVVQNSENMLMFFGRLYQYRLPNNVIHNMTEGFLDDTTELKLRYALKNRQFGRTSNAVDAMQEVNKIFSEPNASAIAARKETLYGTKGNKRILKTQKEFLRDVLGKDYDAMSSQELGMYTDILIASNLPDDQIIAEIKQKFDTRYKEAEYVFDTSRPLGSKSKTRHALASYLQPEEKDFFVTSVESQLNEHGYTLYDHVNEKGVGQIFDPTKEQKGFIPTVLVPMFPELVRPQDQTFMPMKLMFVDELGTYELEPIIINEGTDKEITAAFQISDEMKNYLGSPQSVLDSLSAEELQEMFDRATTVIGGDRANPALLF